MLTDLVVSSFSAGIENSHVFRSRGAGVGSYLREVFDFDGAFSSYSSLSRALRHSSSVTALKYDQEHVSDASQVIRSAAHNLFHVPYPRWTALHGHPTGAGALHPLVPEYMLYHALTLSRVGV